MSERKIKYVLGGIGDFLQTIEDARQQGYIRVYTHFKNPHEFYEPIGIEIEAIRFQSFTCKIEEELRRHEPLERSYFPKIELPKPSQERAQARLNKRARTIGIHPKGSAHSNEYWSRLGMPPKYLPPQFIRALIEPQVRYLIFGAPGELLEYRQLQSDEIELVEERLWDSFALIEICDQIIAVDSAVKAYAAIRRIPSVVLVGDYRDEFRDRMFLDPYCESMHVLKFTALDQVVLQRVRDALAVGGERSGERRG